MQVKVKDKRIKEAAAMPYGTGGKLPADVSDKIRDRLAVVDAADNITQVANAHIEWRVHRWKGSKVRWSIDVLANTRLLFDYNKETHQISGMIYHDPH